MLLKHNLLCQWSGQSTDNVLTVKCKIYCGAVLTRVATGGPSGCQGQSGVSRVQRQVQRCEVSCDGQPEKIVF